MDELNAVVKSESLSSYLTCYTNEDEKLSPRADLQIFANTKSRFFVHYNDDIIHKGNERQLDTFRNNDQPSGSSAPTLRTFQERLMLEHQKNESSDKVHLEESFEQVRYNQPFDVDKFRRNSSREVSNSVKQSFWTGWRSGHPKKDFGIGVPGSNQVPVLTEVCENSTTVQTSRHRFSEEMLTVRSHSFTRQDRVNHNVDTSLESNKVTKSDECVEEKELIRPRDGSTLMNASQDGHHGSQETFTLNSERNVDIQSMRQSLQNLSSPIKKFDLIQSLVLRLANQKPDERFATVQECIENDVLGVSGENGNSNSNTIEDLLWPVNVTTPHPLQTSVAKLLNALLSFEVGRNYFSKLSMVKLLTWSGNEQIYDSMAENLMDALKKLSLDQFQRRDMLEKGLLQWLINHMETVEHSASMAQMECMTDLLRVLINVENSTEFASVNVPHLIVVLARYLNVANEYVQVNVGHVLRTLFLNDATVAIGNKINLHRIISNILEKTSHSKLRAELQYICELFVKHRTDSSTNPELSAENVNHSTVLENDPCLSCEDLNSDIVNQNEQLICEQNLMQRAEFIAERKSNEDEIEYVENSQIPAGPNENGPSDLRTFIVQLCVEKNTGEIDSKTSDNEQNDECLAINSNIGAKVLYSNSRLQRSSSLLSSGSQCASSECKESAIQILKKQTIEANANVKMDQKSQNSVKLPSSKLLLKEMYGNPMDYSDLTSIAKNREVRNEILENDSFIDELCEKVFNKLRSKLAANFFCGPNCGNTSGNCC